MIDMKKTYSAPKIEDIRIMALRYWPEATDFNGHQTVRHQ